LPEQTEGDEGVTVGLRTVTADVVAKHPFTSVKVNVAVPALSPVTTPDGDTDATDGLLLTQVPPDAGERVVVCPAQMVLLPVMLTVGFGCTVTVRLVEAVQPNALVTVTE
jgi:hypothetical protein